MTLSTEDAKLYYRLWLPVLDYVNKKYGINENLKQIAGAEGLDPKDVKEVANKLWEDVAVLDEYLVGHADELSEEHRTIVESWKRKISGRFVLERHLKKGSVFVSMEDEKVYLVSGINSSWEEMFWFRPVPIMMQATLIPFKNVIISDGLVMPYNIMIGRNMAREFKDIYMTAKKSGELVKTL